MADHVLLCLKCRGSGHDVEHCSLDQWASELEWFFSSARSETRFGTSWDDGANHICARCKDLNVISLLETPPPWKLQIDFDNNFDEQTEYVRKLGKTGNIQFWADCNVCCCLWAVTPNPSSPDQDVFLVPDWTISRLSGELGAVTMDTPEKRNYATCLLSVLKPSSISLGARLVGHRGDALCLLQEHCPGKMALGGRRLQPDTINAQTILGWIDACKLRHDEWCLPKSTKALENIRLINVNTREVVRYPGGKCEYIAVSYVWGNIPQTNYHLGDFVRSLPKTLEDALTLTQQLGRNFAWIDSICIDQSNPDDKTDQINRMWSIYQGAWITVIALSGTTADSGFSRISRHKQHPQLTCKVDGKVLVSTMPTLSQQIWTSSWGRRAWTLQEGLLSARCLYISDHQIYYDCASMQCSETLDESLSWAHNLTPASNTTQEGFVTWMLRQAGAGALRIPLDWPSRRLEHWGEKLNLYSYRTMTYPVDAIRAFNGVLQRLETIYPRGFFWGLPIEDFDWALTWAAQAPPQRRTGFPSWSWAGWSVPLFFGQPIDVKKTRRIPTPLEITTVEAGESRRIFFSECDRPQQENGINVTILGDPVHTATKKTLANNSPTAFAHEIIEKNGYLSITAVCLEFTPDFSNPRKGTYAMGQLETFGFVVKDVRCYIRIMSMDPYISGKWIDETWTYMKKTKPDLFVLLARDHLQGFILHKLLVVSTNDDLGIAERITIIELLVPLDDLDVLVEFRPQLRKIMLG